MTPRHTDIESRNRATEAFAERLELEIHAIALLLTAIVLAMRLVAGRQDVTPEASTWEQNAAQDSAESRAASNAATPPPSKGPDPMPAR